jgi:hypothetical protein
MIIHRLDEATRSLVESVVPRWTEMRARKSQPRKMVAAAPAMSGKRTHKPQSRRSVRVVTARHSKDAREIS